jgi:hypothetical protein
MVSTSLQSRVEKLKLGETDYKNLPPIEAITQELVPL